MRELATLNPDLASERTLPAKVIEALRLMPRGMHPMDALRTGVSMLAGFDAELNDQSHAANLRKAIRLIPKISTLVIDGWRIQPGQELIAAKADLPTAAKVLH